MEPPQYRFRFAFFSQAKKDSMFHYFHYLYIIFICRNIRSQWHIYVSPSSVFSIWSQSPSSHHVEVLSVAFDVDYITRVSVFGIDRLILQLTVPWGCWQIGVFFWKFKGETSCLCRQGEYKREIATGRMLFLVHCILGGDVCNKVCFMAI